MLKPRSAFSRTSARSRRLPALVALFARIGVERVELLRSAGRCTCRGRRSRRAAAPSRATGSPSSPRSTRADPRRCRGAIRSSERRARQRRDRRRRRPPRASSARRRRGAPACRCVTAWRRRRRRPELGDDQRHAQRRLVGEDAVRQLAVLAEALAVIGGDDDERLARQARQAIEERAERVVGPGDFAGVRIVGIAPRELLRRLVGRVRIEDVHPREPLVRLRAGPGERRRRRRRRRGARAARSRRCCPSRRCDRRRRRSRRSGRSADRAGSRRRTRRWQSRAPSAASRASPGPGLTR